MEVTGTWIVESTMGCSVVAWEIKMLREMQVMKTWPGKFDGRKDSIKDIHVIHLRLKSVISGCLGQEKWL